jgi:type I restriction enzyme S subunit
VLKRSQIRPGDVLVSIAGSVGRSAVVPDKVPELNCNQAVAIVRTQTNSVYQPYLRYWLESWDAQSQMRGATVTGTISNLSLTQLGNLKLPLPPIAEQRRIAAILDKAEELRELRRQALRELDAIAQSIFMHVHVKSIGEAKSFSLKEIAEPTRNSFVNGPFGSNLLTSELQESGVPVVYIRDIRDGEYQRVSRVFVTPHKAEKLASCSVKPEDVLIAKVGDPPGIAALYPLGEPPGIVTQDVIRIRLNRDTALPQYIAAYLNSSVGKHIIAGIIVRSTRSRFSLGDFKRLEIRLPPIESQREFVRRVEAIEQLKAIHRESLAQLDALFASLQHRAFRGNL